MGLRYLPLQMETVFTEDLSLCQTCLNSLLISSCIFYLALSEEKESCISFSVYYEHIWRGENDHGRSRRKNMF